MEVMHVFKYFLHNNEIMGEVLSESPVNPDGYEVIESEQVLICGAVRQPDGSFTLPTLAPAQLIKQFTAAIEAAYDAKAKEKSYDNRFTCALRAGYTGPFQAEGIAFAQWMDACNAAAYQIMAECLAETRAIPESDAAFVAEVMAANIMVWP